MIYNPSTDDSKKNQEYFLEIIKIFDAIMKIEKINRNEFQNFQDFLLKHKSFMEVFSSFFLIFLFWFPSKPEKIDNSFFLEIL